MFPPGIAESFDRVKDWESWGIPMEVDGKWEFTGHAFPGRPRLHLKYAGAEQKIILTREAQRRGVTIMNKLPITDIGQNRYRGGKTVEVRR